MELAVDLSYSQSANIDFVAMRSAASIAIFKAGGSNTGSRYVDSKYNYFVPKARAAGFAIGHYWFNGELDPTADADFFVNNLNGYTESDLLVLDVEGEAGTANVPWNPTRALQFAQQVKARAGSVITVYMSTSVTHAFDWSAVVAFGCKLWVADYTGGTPHPSYWPSYSAHQYSSSGSLPGFSGRLDVSNVYDPNWVSSAGPVQQTNYEDIEMYVKGKDNPQVYAVFTDANGNPRMRACGINESSFATKGNLVIAGGDNATVENMGSEFGYAYQTPIPLPSVVISDAQAISLATDIASKLNGNGGTGDGSGLTQEQLTAAVSAALKSTPLSVDGTAIAKAVNDDASTRRSAWK